MAVLIFTLRYVCRTWPFWMLLAATCPSTRGDAIYLFHPVPPRRVRPNHFSWSLTRLRKIASAYAGWMTAPENRLSNFQTCRAACPPYVVPAFRHKQCMNPASLQFRLSLSRAILSMRISVHYRARRGEWRKTILSRKLICAVILFKHKQLRPRVRTLII